MAPPYLSSCEEAAGGAALGQELLELPVMLLDFLGAQQTHTPLGEGGQTHTPLGGKPRPTPH